MAQTTLGGWLVHVMGRSDGALSLEEALHVIMDSMKDYFPSQSVAVILIDDDTKALRIKISRQISYTFVKQYHKDGPSKVAEQVVLEQRPILLNDIDPTSDVYQNLKLEHDFVSGVIAPIIKNQRGVGYIFCDRTDDAPFNDADLLHLQVIGLLVGSMIQKFELIQAGKKLSQLDDSTQTLQYKSFVPAFATELERASTHNYAVGLALVSVEAFRKYIETYGINEAHGLLEEVAGIIKQHTRDMDVLARFGADEFILCLSGVNAEDAQQKLNDIHNAISEQAVGQGDSAIMVSIGALSLSTPKDLKRSLQDILGALGKNLVAAKDQGRSCVLLSAMPE